MMKVPKLKKKRNGIDLYSVKFVYGVRDQKTFVVNTTGKFVYAFNFR